MAKMPHLYWTRPEDTWPNSVTCFSFLNRPLEFVCQAAADVAFVVDSSGSISRRNWFKMLHFLKNMVKAFNVGPDITHIAVVAYSTTAKVEFRFDTLTGSQVSVLGYYRLIDRMRRQRGFTFIDKALILANREIFTRKAGMRPELPQVQNRISRLAQSVIDVSFIAHVAQLSHSAFHFMSEISRPNHGGLVEG